MPCETVYISIGSNIDPGVYIPKALELLQDRSELDNLTVSSFYLSEALGRPDQPWYRNGVARFSTSLEPESLRSDVLRPIEHECGRVRETDLYAPRTLDLDIILFGGRIIDTEVMTIPDPAIWKHLFVTIPLLEIAPSLHVPGRSLSLSELAVTVDPLALSKDDSLENML